MITSPSLANGLDDEVEPRAVEPEGGVFTRPEPIVGKGGVFTASRPEPEAAASCSSRGIVLKVTQWYSRSLSGTQGHSEVVRGPSHLQLQWSLSLPLRTIVCASAGHDDLAAAARDDVKVLHRVASLVHVPAIETQSRRNQGPSLDINGNQGGPPGRLACPRA